MANNSGIFSWAYFPFSPSMSGQIIHTIWAEFSPLHAADPLDTLQYFSTMVLKTGTGALQGTPHVGMDDAEAIYLIE